MQSTSRSSPSARSSHHCRDRALSSRSWSWRWRPPRRPSVWRSSSPSSAIARPRSSTSTTRCVDEGRRVALEQLLVVLVIALPLAGFLITATIGRRLGPDAFWVPVTAVVLSWVAAMLVVAAVLGGGAGEAGVAVTLWHWISAGALSVDVAFLVDNLTAVLLIVVTTIGMLVHVYSIGYMRHDPGYWRFFAYLNLFMVSMLLLVLADNWLVVFVAWEGVGLCSYLLIGFWYRKRTAAEASKKAFIANRVGDVGFALGIMAIFVDTGTLNIRDSIENLVGAQHLVALPIPI